MQLSATFLFVTAEILPDKVFIAQTFCVHV